MSKEHKLTDIKCPFKKRSKSSGMLYTCNRVCVKVYPGSAGEVWCRSCKLTFAFEVDGQSQVRTLINVQREQ